MASPWLLKKETTGSHVNDWSWHPDDTVAGVKTTAGGSTKADFVYGYDNNGDITSQTVTGAEAYTNTYTYTPGRNVASWKHGSDPLITYGWDKNNNRTSISAGGTLVASTAYRLDNSISHVDNASGPDRDYTYNDAGLLTDDDCNTNSYDDFDRIKTVHASDATGCADAERTTTYTYDGLDRQRSIAVDKGAVNTPDWTTRSVYDGLSTNLVGQTDAANEDESTPEVLYQLDPMGRQVAMEQSGAGAGKSFLDTDGHGNVTTQVTTGNAVACAVKYEPFGNPIDVNTGSDMCASGGSLGSTGNSIWYRGQPRDASTGNYQLGTRTYDPATGTFTTPDAYRISDANTDVSVGVDPLTANTYTYVNGNPINMMDPSGHFSTAGAANEHPTRYTVTIPKSGATYDQKRVADGRGRVWAPRWSDVIPRPKIGGLNDVVASVLAIPTGLADLGANLVQLQLPFTSGYEAYSTNWMRGVMGAEEDTMLGFLTDATLMIGTLGTSTGVKAPSMLAKTTTFGGDLAKSLDEVVAQAGSKTQAVAKGTVPSGQLATNGGMAGVHAAGQIGETMAGIIKNTTRIPSASGKAAYRIPDELNSSVLGEVKNVSHLNYTSQLRDFAAYARQEGLAFTLYTRGSTTFSSTLQAEIDAGRIVLDSTRLGP